MQALAEELGQIEYASSAIVVTGHSLADVADPLRGSGLVVPSAEKRSILSVSYASRKFAGRAPAGKVVLRTFVGGALQPEVLNHKDDELIRIVTDELQSILGVRGKPDFAVVAHHRRGCRNTTSAISIVWNGSNGCWTLIRGWHWRATRSQASAFPTVSTAANEPPSEFSKCSIPRNGE